MIQQLATLNEDLLFRSLSAGMVGTWYWDLITNKVHADEAIASLFGLDPDRAMQGVSISEFIQVMHPDDRERVQQAIQDSMETLQPYEVEYRLVQGKKEDRWILARGRIETDGSGKAVSFPGLIIDITDRKNAEEEARESEERLRFMADSMPQLVWVTRPDGYHEYYNKQWYDYTGTQPGDTDGDGWNKLFHEGDRERARKAWQYSLKTGEPYEIEYRLYHAPSKSYRWVIGRASPFRDEEGEIVKWYGTCTDIDEQKRAVQIQAFMAEASKELSSTLDYKETLKKVTQLCVPHIADWCSVDLYDKEKGFTQVSVAHVDPDKVSQAIEFRKAFPLHINDPTGVPAVVRTGNVEYYPYLDEQMLGEIIKDEEQLKQLLSYNLRSIIIAPIKINGKPVGGITFVSSESGLYYTETELAMAEDLATRISITITNASLYETVASELKQRKKLERELLDEKQKLEDRVKERTRQLLATNAELEDKTTNLARSNQELENFAYVASHDLQEPLRKIQAFGNLLESELGASLGNDGLDYLNRMRNAASRMSTLIQDLLSFSRVSTKQNSSASVNMNDVVSEVIGDIETLIQDVNGAVRVGTLPTVVADPTHIRQLFQNLIGNALKFHQPDVAPVVEVSSREDNGWIEISVKDNGIGFDEKYLDRIFTVFQRLHDRASYEGTGIGLAVCRKIAERYGGMITATSKKNKGSTFIVRLPKTIKES